METSQTIGNIAKALSQAQGQFKPIKRESVNPFFHSKYADLSAIIEATKEALTNNGLALMQLVSVTDGKVNVTTLLAHETGEWVKDTLSLTPKADDPQSVGSATTYARRYGLGGMLGVASEDDDDANAATKPEPQGIKEHWCYKHGREYFKKGGMKSHGHPMGPNEPWCQEMEPTLFDYAAAHKVTDKQLIEHFKEANLAAIFKLEGVTHKDILEAIDDIGQPK